MIYRDSYSEDGREKEVEMDDDDTTPSRHRFIVVEQMPVSFWRWLNGYRPLSPKSAAKLVEEFSAVGVKAIVLPPGCYIGD